MIVVVVLVFGALALAAAAFAVLPLLRGAKGAAPRRPYLALGVGLAVLVSGLGVYALEGQPGLALRALKAPDNGDLTSLIASLAVKIRERPNDVQGWTILGRGYLALGQSDQAVKALGHAVDLAKAQGESSAALLISYAVALSVEGGMVTKDAEAALQEAYDQDPTNLDAHYYLGYARAARGDKEGALKLWEGLAAAAPPDAPWRQDLPAQIAALQGAGAPPGVGAPTGAGAAPDIQAMVKQLAARLDANPKDLDGWIMLIRSYAVLGDKDKLNAALTKARAVFAGDAAALGALDQQARQGAGAGASPGAGTPPDVQAMVQNLAARLDANPKDLDGWIMLIRSYAALGDKDKAKAALAKARLVFVGDAGARRTLDQQAQASAVE